MRTSRYRAAPIRRRRQEIPAKQRNTTSELGAQKKKTRPASRVEQQVERELGLRSREVLGEKKGPACHGEDAVRALEKPEDRLRRYGGESARIAARERPASPLRRDRRTAPRPAFEPNSRARMGIGGRNSHTPVKRTYPVDVVTSRAAAHDPRHRIPHAELDLVGNRRGFGGDTTGGRSTGGAQRAAILASLDSRAEGRWRVEPR